VKNGNLPNFEIVDFMERPFRQLLVERRGPRESTRTNGEQRLRGRPFGRGGQQLAIWKDTAIFVVEDDAQNGPDHVDAHRSTVFVASPYTDSGSVVHTMYNSTNVLRTIEDILGVNHLGLNDANAFPMSDVFIKEPNLSPMSHPYRYPLRTTG